MNSVSTYRPPPLRSSTIRPLWLKHVNRQSVPKSETEPAASSSSADFDPQHLPTPLPPDASSAINAKPVTSSPIAACSLPLKRRRQDRQRLNLVNESIGAHDTLRNLSPRPHSALPVRLPIDGQVVLPSPGLQACPPGPMTPTDCSQNDLRLHRNDLPLRPPQAVSGQHPASEPSGCCGCSIPGPTGGPTSGLVGAGTSGLVGAGWGGTLRQNKGCGYPALR